MTNRFRLVSVLLFGSLAANLFLAGLMAGRWFDHPPPPQFERRAPDPGQEGGPPGWMRRALGPDAAQELQAVWEVHASEIEPIRSALQRSRDAVGDALAAEPFDPQAYATAIDEMQQMRIQLYAVINTVMTDVVSRLTPEQRRRMVERSREWERRKAGRE